MSTFKIKRIISVGKKKDKKDFAQITYVDSRGDIRTKHVKSHKEFGYVDNMGNRYL